MPYPSRTRRNCSIAELKAGFGVGEIWLAGRIVGVLDDGLVLQDESGRVEIKNEELRMKNDGLGISKRELFQVGDIVEVRVSPENGVDLHGRPFVFYLQKELCVLAPCDTEFFIRREDPNYRKMIVDLNLKEKLVQRAKIFQKIREFFNDRGFLEADTPSLVRLPGMEPYLDVFKTQFFPDPEKKKPTEDMYLITSPEYALKKLLVTGFEKVFQIARSFRNKETDSKTHNPEFSLLEWYRAYASYLDIMEDAEKLVAFLAVEVSGKPEISYQGHSIDVSGSWQRLRVSEAFEKYAGVALKDFEDPEKLKQIAREKGYGITPASSYDDAFFIIFMNEIEPKLGFDKPVILYEYPVSMAALSKVCDGNPKYAQRFEVYIAGMELANAFTELNDPSEQQKRLETEREERQHLEKDIYPVDQKFIDALRFGMPPSGGIALGVDRLVMLLTDTSDINNILFFPQRDL